MSSVSAVVSLPPLPHWQFKVWQQPSARNAPYNLNQPTNHEASLAITVASNICTTKERLADSPPPPLLLHSPFPSTMTPPLLPLCLDPKSSSTPVTRLPSALISLHPLDWVLEYSSHCTVNCLTLHPTGHTPESGLICRPHSWRDVILAVDLFCKEHW